MVYEKECLIEVNSLDEYLRFIKSYRRKVKSEIWYRGQRCNKWDLKPNLYREAKIKKQSSSEVIKLKYDLVNFKDIFLEFKNEVIRKNLINISKLNDFQVMFIARHYGLLTPTLDWTTDPLVAMFFALDEYDFKDDSFPVIYILKPCLCNESSFLVYSDGTNITEPVCIDNRENMFDTLTKDLNDTPSNHIPIAIYTEKDFSYRICRQSGKFTFHGALGPLNYSWNNIVINGEKIVDAIKINPKAVEEIKERLLALDINKLSIYRHISHLDGICKQLNDEALVKLKMKISEMNKYLTK